MTGTERSSAGLDPRRKRMLFQCWHRGIREMDLLFGQFADAHIGELDDSELDRLEILMRFPDPVLFRWISGAEPVPADVDSNFLDRIAAFHRNAHS